ncbi:hypothetical protein [Henriciella mobilis]|uniref:Uncharacterized protein n=1 Tax=Henriciella mobilis TaxID=2305467 RepID=A0A399RF42_9PROT|nr:hypothetical protein [Henriciella mobilis]RIJ30186.1 hypothetical protein D1223_05930 [Henriciella mobilis]
MPAIEIVMQIVPSALLAFSASGMPSDAAQTCAMNVSAEVSTSRDDCIFIRQSGDICLYWCDGNYELRVCE